MLVVFVVGAGAGGCSSGGGKPASPTTSTPASSLTTTTSATTATTATATQRVVALAECPKDNPSSAIVRLNTGYDVAGDLVPIDALNIRVCKYRAGGKSPHLLGISWLALSVAAAFRAETNDLPAAHEPRAGCAGGSQEASEFFLTFAVDTQTTNLALSGCPPIVSNGTLTARATAKWYRELARLTPDTTTTTTTTTTTPTSTTAGLNG